MKLSGWRKGFLVLAILVGIYFVLKQAGLYFVRPILEQELSEATKLKIRIGAIHYSILGRSVSVRDLSIKDHNNILLNLHRLEVAIKVSPFHPFTVPVELRVEFPQKGTLDFLAAYGVRTQALDGKFQLKQYALANAKDILKKYFSLVPKNGIVDLDSNFQLQGTKLRSLHHIKIENFDYAPLQGVVSVVGGALLGGPLGLTGGMLSALTKDHKGSLAFSFRLDGDLADKKFNWSNVVSAAVSKAFQNALQGSAGNVTQPASELVNTIKDALP